LSEFEALRCEKLVAAFVERRRPPPHLRHQVDLGFSVRGQSVEIFEVRARWDDATQTTHEFVAKATFERNSGQWKVYWQRADMKWHSYAPQPRVDTLEEFLALLENDVHACFFG
jgi:spore coat polysaccharide biosynthesis protein SpsF (cytidylyltransferase family)